VLTAFTGCDSIVNLQLTVDPLIETNLTEVLCFGESYEVGPSTYTSTGLYTDVLTAADGCDSIVNLDLTIPELIETSLIESICEGETYEVGSQSFDASGIYQEVLTAENGCDSVVNLDLEVIATVYTELTEFICDGETYTVGTSSYTSTGEYQDMLFATSGCDSIVSLNLTVYEIPVTDLVETVCFGDTYQIGTTVFSESGNFTEVLTAYTGCDSIVNLQLTVDPLIETNLEEIVCFDDSYQVGNSNYDQSGNYTDVLTAINGCDSVVNLSLTVRAINETFLIEEICDGEIYSVGSSQYTTTGTYLDVLTSEETGCDSFVNLALEVISLEETFLTEAICDGESFVVANSTYTESGEYTDVVTSSTGCDSTIYLDLRVYEIPITTLDETICEGETYSVGNSAYTQTGDYTDILQAYTGCDSIVNLNLFVIEQEETFLVEEICDGESYEVGTSSYSTSGDYMDIITSSVGCDSFVYLSLVVNDVYEVFLDELICNDESYEVGINSFNQTGTYTVPLQSVAGCDSIVQLNLTTHPCELSFASAEKSASCNGEADGSITFAMTVGVPPYTYVWEALDGSANGTGELDTNDQNESILGLLAGMYNITVTDYYGVIVDFEIEVTQPEVVLASTDLVTYDIYHTSCFGESDGIATASTNGGTPPYTYLWSHGGTSAVADGLTAGTYYVTVTDQNGCENVAEATLTAPMPLEGDFSTIDPDCYGDEAGVITIENPGGGVAPYVYSVDGLPFSDSNVFGNLGIGSHLIAIQDANGCIWEEEAIIQQPEELTVELGDDILVKLGDSLRMDAITSYPVDSFAWSFIPNSGCINCPDPILAPFSTSTYTVTVTDENGCTATDNIQIFVEKPREVFIPNVFSPNNDGQNDIFMIFAGDDVQKVNSFIVFNRWGETMFEVYNFQPNSPAYGWNGTHRSREMNTGVYVFLAEVEFIDGEVVMFKGDVTLVR
jgi:gliding motility-associated-like protein